MNHALPGVTGAFAVGRGQITAVWQLPDEAVVSGVGSASAAKVMDAVHAAKRCAAATGSSIIASHLGAIHMQRV